MSDDSKDPKDSKPEAAPEVSAYLTQPRRELCHECGRRPVGCNWRWTCDECMRDPDKEQARHEHRLDYVPD